MWCNSNHFSKSFTCPLTRIRFKNFIWIVRCPAPTSDKIINIPFRELLSLIAKSNSLSPATETFTGIRHWSWKTKYHQLQTLKDHLRMTNGQDSTDLIKQLRNHLTYSSHLPIQPLCKLATDSSSTANKSAQLSSCAIAYLIEATWLFILSLFCTLGWLALAEILFPIYHFSCRPVNSTEKPDILKDGRTSVTIPTCSTLECCESNLIQLRSLCSI